MTNRALWFPTLRMVGAMAGGVLRRAPRSAVVGAVVVVGVFAVALLSPLGGYPIGADVDPAVRSQGPSATHWLGTDHLGRDVFWRTLLASRAFAGPGLLSTLVTAVLGIPLGALAGWGRGVGSQGIRGVLGALAAVPSVVLVVLACARYGAGAVQLATFAGIAAAPALAEAIWARIERMRLEDFVLASQAHGLSDARILIVHLVCIACGRTIARKLLEAFGAFVVLECTLSYIGASAGGVGFGVPEPTPSWGNMMAFEWGRGLGSSFLAPALSLWLTVWATVAASGMFAEVDDG